ncbi:hypothetical protein [Priestia megaterium]|uniref:hypothetical protein n=1 Tax=Priestia megaterium TaxID=1404 RepID=UPI002FFEFA83
MMSIKYLYHFEEGPEIVEKQALTISPNMVLTVSYEGLTVHRILQRDDNGVVTDWEHVVETHLFPDTITERIDLTAIKAMTVPEYFVYLATLGENKKSPRLASDGLEN